MYSGAGGIFDVKKINSNVGYSGKNNLIINLHSNLDYI